MAVTTPFDEDFEHASYDPEYARRFFQVLVSTQNVMQEFRGRFIGKCSPVHFFWGSFDLACTRFCGRPAPPRKGVITGPAYSHEVISAGFWPGAGFDGPAFYAYAVPPARRDWSAKSYGRRRRAGISNLGEFILMYDDVRAVGIARATRCWSFCKAPTKQARGWRTGIARRWKRTTRRKEERG